MRKYADKDEREKQALLLADYMIEHNSMIMELEKECMIPHTTAHRRLTITLKDVDYDKWCECQRIMKEHIKQRIDKWIEGMRRAHK